MNIWIWISGIFLSIIIFIISRLDSFFDLLKENGGKRFISLLLCANTAFLAYEAFLFEISSKEIILLITCMITLIDISTIECGYRYRTILYNLFLTLIVITEVVIFAPISLTSIMPIIIQSIFIFMALLQAIDGYIRLGMCYGNPQGRIAALKDFIAGIEKFIAYIVILIILIHLH